MLKISRNIAQPKRKKPEGAIQLQGFPLGENTSVPPSQLTQKELASCIDCKIKQGGRLESREAIVKYTSAGIGSIVDMESVSLDGTNYELVSDGDNKIYYLNNTGGSTVTPVQIGTAATAGTSYFISYNDVALICDGSYLKYCDDTTEIKMAYDAGTGGTMFDNYSGDFDGAVTITTAGAGCTFTTPNWDAGYTIPSTEVFFHGIQSTSGTASIDSVDIWDVSGSAAVATTGFTADIPTASEDFLDVGYTSVIAELEPNKEYYALIKGENFDLSYTDVPSGGKMITAGGTPDTTKNPIMRVHPGLPPKAVFGDVSGNRPWIKNPDEPGRAYFGNLTHLDWSTPNGGGYVGVVDENANSFEIGGIADLFGTPYFYGTEAHPYICKLTGSIPSEYSLPLLFQRTWTTQRTLVNANNDLWNMSATGVDNLNGVQEFGDLRTYTASDPIKDRLKYWDTDTAFAGYHARDGQYWLYMPEFNYINVCHTKYPIRMETGEVRYPWSRYTPPAIPTQFKEVGNNFLMGSSDGFVYKLDSTEYKDLATDHIHPSFKTARIEIPFRTVDLIRIQFIGASRAGSQFNLDIYKNGNSSKSVNTWEVLFPMSDSLTVDELIMDIGDMLFSIDPEQTPLYFRINVNVRSFQIECSQIHIAGYPVFFDGVLVNYRGREI